MRPLKNQIISISRRWKEKKAKLKEALEPIAKELNFSGDSGNGDPNWVNNSGREFEQLRKKHELAKPSEKPGIAQDMRLNPGEV